MFILLEKRLCQLFPEGLLLTIFILTFYLFIRWLVSKADCTDERKAELYEVLHRYKGILLLNEYL